MNTLRARWRHVAVLFTSMISTMTLSPNGAH